MFDFKEMKKYLNEFDDRTFIGSSSSYLIECVCVCVRVYVCVLGDGGRPAVNYIVWLETR